MDREEGEEGSGTEGSGDERRKARRVMVPPGVFVPWAPSPHVCGTAPTSEDCFNACASLPFLQWVAGTCIHHTRQQI